MILHVSERAVLIRKIETSKLLDLGSRLLEYMMHPSRLVRCPAITYSFGTLQSILECGHFHANAQHAASAA